jgi:hypothetical protein
MSPAVMLAVLYSRSIAGAGAPPTGAWALAGAAMTVEVRNAATRGAQRPTERGCLRGCM